MNNLEKILKERNISQTDLAQKLGVSIQRVNRWIRGNNYPHKKYIKAISILLKVSVEKLFFSEDK